MDIDSAARERENGHRRGDLVEGIDRVGVPVSVEEIAAFIARLGVGSPAGGDGDRVDRIGVLEGLKAAAAAAQAHDLVAFADSQVEDQAARGVKARDRGSGIGAQVGLATRNSPHKGGRMLTTARALLADLPHTLAALARGETSEHRAGIIAKETSVLEPEDRRRVDAELADRLPELGDRRVEAETRAWVYRLDPHATVRRAAKARADRRVTIRPAPDTMTYVTGLLPVEDGVAVYAALDAAAKAAAAAGDGRSRGQVMADTLVARVTGTAAGAHPVEIQLVMTDRALLGGGHEPALVPHRQPQDQVREGKVGEQAEVPEQGLAVCDRPGVEVGPVGGDLGQRPHCHHARPPHARWAPMQPPGAAPPTASQSPCSGPGGHRG